MILGHSIWQIKWFRILSLFRYRVSSSSQPDSSRRFVYCDIVHGRSTDRPGSGRQLRGNDAVNIFAAYQLAEGAKCSTGEILWVEWHNSRHWKRGTTPSPASGLAVSPHPLPPIVALQQLIKQYELYLLAIRKLRFIYF